MATDYISDLKLGAYYNFTLLATGILGAGYSNAKLSALLDYDSAKQIEDVDGLHAAVLPLLPAGTPTSAASLNYVKIVTSTGQVVVLAQDWFSAAPVLVQGTTATIVVTNITTADLMTLRNLLNANGYSSFTITST